MQIIQNPSFFSLQNSFFFYILLGVFKWDIDSFDSLVLVIINLKIILKAFKPSKFV